MPCPIGIGRQSWLSPQPKPSAARWPRRDAHGLGGRTDIRRLEDLGVTDLQVTPWAEPGIQPELGVSAMREQPPLDVKLEAIKRYGEETIAQFR